MKISSYAVAVAAFISLAVTAAPTGDGFLLYWATFRTAALNGDTARLATMTRFPLRAGFDSDQNHPRPITRAQFARYIKTELGCPSNDTGSHIDAIRRRHGLDPAYDFDDEHNATIGRFAFEKVAGHWQLVMINYGDASEYLDRLQGRC